MTPERWEKIEIILQEALDLPSGERAAFVRKKSGGDEDLRREIERLLARDERDESFLESPVWTDSLFLGADAKRELASSLEDRTPENTEKSFVGRQIGAYRLTEEIGKGGMGVVYLATRADGEFKQKVAVKLIKRGMDTDFILRRFRQERQVAAALNHPHIAKLFDGGTTTDGLPYFVMEYVEGAAFFKYSDANKLNLRAKLELFLKICRAVAYAHKKRIVHRDIKPGNILVTEEGEPKLLDFGIAKILDPELIDESVMPTETQMRLMTPEYASPEQVRGDEITEASDQYSLGVMLYELLTGNRPYKFPSRAPHDIARVICEEMPSEPSSGDFGKFVARNADLSSLDRDFCRKLDRIVLKSLRKNPSERYASVKEFIDDIERFLRNEPVFAETFTSEKESVKFFRENLKYSGGSQKSIAVLPFKILNMQKADTEETDDNGFLGVGLADALITRLSNVRQFLVRPTSSILSYGEQHNDSFAAGEDLRVQFVLDGSIIKTGKRFRVSVQLLNVGEQATVWAERFIENFDDVLNLEDSIASRVAESLVPQLTSGERQNLAKRGTDNAEAYEAYLRGRYHWNSFSEEGFQKAIAFYNRAVELDPNYALAYAAIADYYVWLGVYGAVAPLECYPPAKAAALRSIELNERLAEAYSALGLARLYGEYDWENSEKDALRALEINPNNSVAHLWFSHNLLAQGRFAEGKRHVERAVELDPLAYQNHNTLAWTYFLNRRFDKALQKSDEVIEKFPSISHSYFSKAHYLNRVGRTGEAMVEIKRAMKISNDSLFDTYGLATTLAAAGKRREAVELIEKTEAETKSERFSYYHISIPYCYLGDKDKAFECFEHAFENRESLLIWIGVEPSLDCLRDDPRYFAFLKKINHPTLKTIYKDVSEAENLSRNFNAPAKSPVDSVSQTITGGEMATEKIVAPRRHGIKQGVFLIIVSFLLFPILVALVAAIDFLKPVHLFVSFLLVFGGGLARIFYALFFEPKSGFASADSPPNRHISFSSRPTLRLGENQTDSENSARTNNPKRHWVKRSIYGLAAISLVSFGYLVYHVAVNLEFSSAPKFETGNRLWRDSFAATMMVKRLTTSGKAAQAVLSPDGENVAYIVEDGGQRSLWIRSTNSENARQLIAPDAVFYTEIKFSPDGNYLYYIASRAPARTLYRVSVGGAAATPEKISGNVLNLFAFSPDGRRIVYDSRNSDNNQNSLFIAELDDNSQIKSARTLVVLEIPNYFPGGIAFAPDGEKVVYPRTVIENAKEVLHLFVYDLAAHTNERLGNKNFERINATGWRKDTNEIVVSAKESESGNYQLWVVDYPSGEFVRLTNDFTDYFGVSLTADAATLATTKIALVSNIWTSDLTESNKNFQSKIKQITSNTDRQDGLNGLSRTKDGRILYAARSGAERGIALMNEDGSNNRTIPTGALDPKYPMLTDDNRFLIYADKKEQQLNIWRFEMASEKLTQISSRYAVTPSIAPDNGSIVYAMFPDASSNRLVIHRQSLTGGEEVSLTNETSVRPVVSPDGRFVACNYASDETNKVWQIAILPMEKDSAPKIIQPYKNNFFISPPERPLAWSPDGRFLYFLNNADNITNIFRVAVEGDAAPVQVTHFASGEIFDFALAPDGKSFVLARGTTSSDIIIFQKRAE